MTQDTDFGELACCKALPSGCGIILIELSGSDPDADIASHPPHVSASAGAVARAPRKSLDVGWVQRSKSHHSSIATSEDGGFHRADPKGCGSGASRDGRAKRAPSAVATRNRNSSVG